MLKLEELLAAANWKEITPRLLYYADKLIRRCTWRGLSVCVGARSELCVEGFCAEDFVQDAIGRLLDGRREYNDSVSLEQNLRGIIRSSIWNVNKTARRSGLKENPHADHHGGDDTSIDVPASTASPTESAIQRESMQQQKSLLAKFKASIAEDDELSAIVAALESECIKPRDIQRLTGIDSARVSELKRKLRLRLEQFESEMVGRRDT